MVTSRLRDGQLQPSWASSPEATFYNWAIHPGAERWKPRYRLGKILFVDQTANTAIVELDPQQNSHASKGHAYEATTLELNNPVKYVINPDTGGQEAVLPGPNVLVADGVTTLTDVPIEYMDCNALVFEVDDHVLVEFLDRDWTSPKIIGFAEHPKPCNTLGMVLSGKLRGTTDTVFLRDLSGGQSPRFSHPVGGTLEVGNIDWVSTDKKTRLSWHGPLGRSIPPMIRQTYLNDYFAPGYGARRPA